LEEEDITLLDAWIMVSGNLELKREKGGGEVAG